MKIEENENVEAQTGEVAAAKEEKAPTVLGKFKDVDALSRAYEALEAEFTRRSQKLRLLEKEVENLKALGEPSGVGKLRKTAKSRREAAKEFDAFVAEQNAAKSKPTGEETPEYKEAALEKVADGGMLVEEKEPKVQEEIVSQALADDDVNAEKARATVTEEKQNIGSDLLYRQAMEDEAVRLRIVGEYLTSLGKVDAPLTGGRAGLLTAPPKKAKTVGQAGAMALSYFQKPIVG